jgi:hypothetical protein
MELIALLLQCKAGLRASEYSTIHQGGHDGGDFLFVRQ